MQMHTNDHDLLIRLDANVQNLTLEVKGLRDNTIARIASIEAMKLDKSVFEDFRAENAKTIKSQAEWLESIARKQEKQATYIYIGIGIILTIQFVVILIK